MCRFFSTKSLRADIEKYLKKDEYKNCRQDLCNFFAGKSIADIFAQPILLSANKDFHFIKSRLENSCFNKGKSSGYRLYYYVDGFKEMVYFIGFYPKTGKYGREDLTETELKILIRQFSDEKKQGILLEHNIHNGLQAL
jgi:mRNA-degrading endonuclease RelE of RelBE toxin-antitoxin system